MEGRIATRGDMPSFFVADHTSEDRGVEEGLLWISIAGCGAPVIGSSGRLTWQLPSAEFQARPVTSFRTDS